MIELFSKKEKCCGCGACANICPKMAISMKKDEYGFIYPQIDRECCVECGLCKKICAFQKQLEGEKPKKVYALSTRNESLLKMSASGGVFATMSTFVLKSGGYVYGSVMQHEKSKLYVKHICCDTKEKLSFIQGSKYIQSSMERIFKDIKKRLKEGSFILFSGTPCQVDSLKSYLKYEYKNLLTVDIICHGVPNEKIFNDYIERLNKKINGNIYNFKFRDKSLGWGYNLVAEYLDEKGNEKKFIIDNSDSSYFFMFINGILLRENCYYCKYANKKRVGDITIGDYWGIEIEHPEILQCNGGDLDMQKGISTLFINSEAGLEFFDKIKEQFYYHESTFEKASKWNTQLKHPVKYPKSRKLIMDLYKNIGYAGVEKVFQCQRIRNGIKKSVRGLLKHFI